MKILITGAAGFIGFHAAREFLRRGWDVAGIDNFSDYYDVSLKRDRAAQLSMHMYENDICDLKAIDCISPHSLESATPSLTRSSIRKRMSKAF